MAWTKALAAIAAIVISPVLLIFSVPFAIGIISDMIVAAGIMPALVTVGCVAALAASLSTRIRAR